MEGIKVKREYIFFSLSGPQSLCKLSALSWQIMRKISCALEAFSKSAREAGNLWDFIQWMDNLGFRKGSHLIFHGNILMLQVTISNPNCIFSCICSLRGISLNW